MTLLEEYRRAVYSTSNEERARRLQPLSVQAAGSAALAARFDTTVSLEPISNAAKHNKRQFKPASRAVRLQGLSSSDSTTSTSPQPWDDEQLSTHTKPAAKRPHPASSLSPPTKLVRDVAGDSPNQHDSARVNACSRDALLEQRNSSAVQRVALLSSHAASQIGRRGGDASSSTISQQIPTELPSQFIHHAVVSISKWTVIVSDTTLQRIAARNRRIARAKQRRLLHTASSARSARTGASNTASDALESATDAAAEPTRMLVLNGAEKITDAGLQAIADSVPALEALEVAGAKLITDTGLRSLALSCPQLTRLNVSQCSSVRGPGLAAIADHAHVLRELALADCSQIGAYALLRCVYGFPLLEHLNVARCAQISDDILKTLALQCRALRSLVLTNCERVSDVGVVHVAQHCTQLEVIALSRTISTEKITDTACAALGEHCPLLRDVSLAGCNFLTDAAIQWLAAGCKRLERLDITNVFYLTDVAMRALSDHCTEMTTLRLSNVKNVSDVGLRLLARSCHKLASLHVSNLYLVSDGSNRDFGLEGLRAISSECPLLTDLNLSGCFQLVERALVAISNGCKRLERINLKACPNITLVAIQAVLRGCDRLVTINLSGVVLCANAVLATIATHCAYVRELTIAQCDKVSDRGLRHLAARADQFELLDVSGCVLITDAGVNAFVDGFQRPRLAHLLLAGCTLVTQDAIARLAFACPLLLTLSVHGCRVSPRVLRSLSSSWPFGVLCLPTSSTSSAASDLGIFPMHRAKDWRFVHESCAEWLAVVKIQNLYRAKRARVLALARREHATRVYVARRLQSLWRGRRARRDVLVRKVLRSGRDKFATKIQRRFRAKRLGRRTQQQVAVVHEQQLDKCVRYIQRRYRAKRAANVAKLIYAAKKRQFERETYAAITLQRRVRGRSSRHRVDLLRVQKQALEREQRDASLRIQTIYRGRADRRKAMELQRARERDIVLLHARVTQLQAHFRRRMACRVANARRQALLDRERAATTLQLAFRARKARETLNVMRIANHHRASDRAARLIQKRWRTRADRIGLALVLDVRRARLARRERAAIHLQQASRRFLTRKRARNIMVGLLKQRQRAFDMEVWAATRVQATWRRREAMHELERVQALKRARWKQLIDTYNQHGMGYGAPFYYNQVNQDIRWRMPRELLELSPRPNCDQCERLACASIECATCGEFFCDVCNDVVHGHGKRQQHDMRKLFNYYGIRRDYGDGVFPSVWPSEIAQDDVRGYDFVAMAPRADYQNMLWRIAQFVPVVTGKWGTTEAATAAIAAATIPTEEEDESNQTISNAMPPEASEVSGALFHESDVDASGQSLWEVFYDYTKQEYRQYHRLSKRVKPLDAATGDDYEVTFGDVNRSDMGVANE